MSDVQPTQWIVADVHGGTDPDSDRAFLGLLMHAERVRVDLIVLGDLFTAWIGTMRLLTELQRRVVDRFIDLRKNGQRITLVAGNRDYFVREGLLGLAFDRVIESEEVIDIGGEPSLVCHGDGLNRRDIGYRIWRRVSRNRIAWNLIRRGSPEAIHALVSTMARALGRASYRKKDGGLPLDALRLLGQRAKNSGAMRALVGHFHDDRSIAVEGGVPVILVPAWFTSRSVAVVHQGSNRGLSMQVWDSNMQTLALKDAQ